MSDDSGEEDKASEKQRFSRGGVFESHVLCSCGYPGLYHSCAVPKTPEFFITEKLKKVIWERGKRNGVPSPSKQHLVKHST